MFFSDNNNLKQLSNAIRFLAIDAVEKAKSGHPGMPMGFADVATILFAEFLKFNPADPNWPNRDRFILSAGHGSMLLYALLYLTGYDLSIQDIENFRQLNSKTPGHPEYGHTPGVETTTGPLGQGFANSIGMAIGQKLLQARLGESINYKTYVVVGDGCLMEGISYEASSLAGHLCLNDLIVLYDSNKISIDGSTDLAFTENVMGRFESQGWNVFKANGHNFDEIRGSLYKATKSTKPALVIFNTKIGYGSPGKEGSEKSHGSPLGTEEIKLAREKLNYPHKPFEILEELLGKWRAIGSKHKKLYDEWVRLHGGKVEQLCQVEYNSIEAELSELKKEYSTNSEATPSEATRRSLYKILARIMPLHPLMIGGSADLSESNGTKAPTAKNIHKDDFSGNYIHYGVREHAMAAIMNGLALTGFTVYGGSFLVFSDYMRPAIRLSALMKLPVIYVFSHDSIGVGEDGPTHQPIEHLGSLRMIPGLSVFRPADSIETIDCFQQALVNKTGPSALILSRQNLPSMAPGPVIYTAGTGKQKIDLLASGSEVSIALEAAKILGKDFSVKVFSVPNLSQFDKSLLTERALIIAIEASNDPAWREIIGDNGIFVGMKSFGSSAKADDLFKLYGINADNIVAIVRARINE